MNPGSETLALTLRRQSPSEPWGFRLQGGMDFSTPLSIQSVNNGGVAERCGAMPGDAVLSINGRPSDELEHEEAKHLILVAGTEVQMVVQRGAVKVWKPKVTPMSELRPNQMSYPAGDGDNFVQKTSLAADKRDVMHIGSTHNRTARPFPGFGGGASSTSSSSASYSAPSQQPSYQGQQAPYQGQQASYQGQQPSYQQDQTVPAVVNAQYNTPINMYSTQNTMDTYNQQAQALTGDMQGLKVADNTDGLGQRSPSPSTNYLSVQEGGSRPATVHSASPTMLALQEEEHARVSRQSPSMTYLTPQSQDSQMASPAMRSVSPTMLALQEEEQAKAAASSKSPKQSAMYIETKEGEEIKYQGYTNPHKQSRSFQMLQMGLESEQNGGVSADGNGAARISGMRSVKAPTTKPNVERKEAQYMTCKVCGSLCVGVFVKIKGEPMHPECYKCVRCHKSLKQQGFFTIEGKLHCEACAQIVSAPPGADQVATVVYR